jgi:hypothetical protein
MRHRWIAAALEEAEWERFPHPSHHGIRLRGRVYFGISTAAELPGAT